MNCSLIIIVWYWTKYGQFSLKLLVVLIYPRDNVQNQFHYNFSNSYRGKAPVSPAQLQLNLTSSRNNPTYTLLFTKCNHVLGCFVMMLHSENVRMGWSWAVTHRVPGVLSRNQPRPNCHGNQTQAIHPQALQTEDTCNLAHSERRPQNIYSQEEMNFYCIIKLATEISLFSLQISKTWCFG